MLKKDKEACCGCSACVGICPVKCIRMTADEEGFFYPVIDSERCIHCGACEAVCPVEKNRNLDASSDTSAVFTAYTAYSKTEECRLCSSSGGIFSLLAQKILSSGGIVYGAAMSEDCKSVRHISVASEKDLWALQGSKYVQSDLENIFLDVKKQLIAGKIVLFSGTPCQIEGLKSFLQKDYERLICVDMICHGVPSPMVWERYLCALEKKYNSRAVRVSFREKRFGWRMYSLSVVFENNRKYRKILKEDLYGQAFLQNLILRPSCHACAFKKLNRMSDITLADSWKNPSNIKDDDRGLSLTLVHTDKGRLLLDSIKDGMALDKIDSVTAIKGNTPMYRSSNPHSKRAEFFDRWEQNDINVLFRKYVNTKKSLRWKLRSFIKWIQFYKYKT